MTTTPRFNLGDRVRVVDYPTSNPKHTWVGETGTIVRTPDMEATPGAGPSTTYAVTFDSRPQWEKGFAPFTDDQLEAIA